MAEPTVMQMADTLYRGHTTTHTPACPPVGRYNECREVGLHTPLLLNIELEIQNQRKRRGRERWG
jgi:hypothetical protein